MSKEVLFFGAPEWCHACEVTEPIFRKVCENENIEHRVYDADIDDDAIKQYSVRGVPTTILLEDGTELKRKVGSYTAEQLKDFLK